MPPGYIHQGSVSFQTVHDRLLPPLDAQLKLSQGHKASWRPQDSRYVLYTIQVDGRCSPAYGDGWNEPREPAYAEVESIRVTKIEISRTEGQEVVIEEGFIGPIEHGVVPIGGQLIVNKECLQQFENECSQHLYGQWEDAVHDCYE